ncbi:MAG: single-stranded DNA-binding protein [Bacteroidales bacterium]|nr:single-stranded DNA-binding protein [Bacteroidales bacterium]
MSVNKVILVGNVGKDPETRYLDESTAITKFPMATSETYKNKAGERVSTTEWHNIVLWRGLAQVAEKYVKKGTQIYIEGRIKTRSYEDADGNKKYITEIVGDQMQLLGRKPDDADGDTQGSGGYTERTSPASSGAQSSQDKPQAQERSPSRETGPEDDPFDEGDNGPDDLPF